MRIYQAGMKRFFDIVFSGTGLLFSSWLIITAWIIIRCKTGGRGFFLQERIGKGGTTFKIIKMRTMQESATIGSTVTTKNDTRITDIGKKIRKYKFDELPQLVNVLLGDMSLVGPRPDVAGFADKLEGSQNKILSIRPGITGPATLKYRFEENILDNQKDPEKYNREVIWPDKVKINLQYIENYSFITDLKIIINTVIG